MSRRRIRVLGILHVEWAVLKQRPQWLFEAMTDRPELSVTVTYAQYWRRKYRAAVARNVSHVRLVPITYLPFGRFRWIRWLNGRLFPVCILLIHRLWRPDVVVVTHPTLLPLLPRRLRAQPLAYDCMDLADGFAEEDHERMRIRELERDLVADCDVVFVTSQHLATLIRERYDPTCPVVVVRNGYPASWRPATGHRRADGRVRLGYFGYVGAWFDMDTVCWALDNNPDLELHVWGPVEDGIAACDRFIRHGTIEHGDLPAAASEVDCLVMPFLVNELTLGVDPIKLYEYVALGLPIITVFYDELQHFANLVHFYRDRGQFNELVDLLRQDALAGPSPDVRTSFLEAATWGRRAEQVAVALADAVARSSVTPTTT